MCIFGGGGSTPSMEPLQTFAPPEPRQVTAQNPLPKKRDLEDIGEVKDVAYGGEQTKSNPAAGKKKGAAQLKIALNTGQAGAGTGGISGV
tara:strand:- start:224 stop:493 length:270 start_codon:yes stop_codon:yes gene_type:complete